MVIEKFNQCCLFFSNKVEALFETLQENLFGQHSTLFSERILLFPTREMEKWVTLRLAEQLGIAAGLKTFHLNKAISVFSQDLCLSKKPFFLPDEFELTLKLEELMSESLCQKNTLFEPLQSYLKGKEKRVIFLARRLATLFQKYGIYGKTLCEKWEKNPQNWQELLWKMTFDKWDYPLRILPSLELKEERKEISIHLFSFSYLSPLHFHFFQKLGQAHKVYFYQLSPCLEFWSDLPSKRQAVHMDETSLFDVHPLLAFTGKVGREMAKIIEDAEEVSVFENYKRTSAHTALEKLQENLLLMKQESLPEDPSIEIHISKTEVREVQCLYNFILNLMDKKGYQPNDFLVLAPDISFYEPFIRSIFDNPQIADIQTLRTNKLVEGFFLLLELDEKRWSATSVLQLFDHPHFKKKMGWGKEDVLLIRKWIEKTGIRWGLNKSHRDFLLKESFCNKPMQEEKATWKNGIDFLLEKLAHQSDENWIDFTSAELLGECAQILENLSQDLEELRNKKTLNEWRNYFLELVETYFAKSEENEFFSESLNRFSKANAWFQKKYPFHTLLFLLKEWMGKVPVTLNSHILSSVSFCSILPMRAIPAKVICLIGMNETVFPRKDMLKSLDLLWKQKEGDFSPSKTDFDRYLFLEAILSARNVLMLSYLDNDTAPSPLVTELARGFYQKKIISHPAKSHDISYFNQKEPDLINFSQNDYELALRFKKKKEVPSYFVKKSKNALPQGDLLIDVADLNRVLRSPLKPYFANRSGYPFREEIELEDEESFCLSSLKKNEIRRRSLKESSEHLLRKIEKEKGFPLGMFGRATQSSLAKEISKIKENLNSFTFYSVEMVLHEKKLYFDDVGTWRTPPIQLDLYPNRKVTIVGKIEGVYEQGLLSLNKSSFSNAVKVWPFFLVANLITLPPNCIMEGVFFAEDNVFKKQFLSKDEVKATLSFLVEYYYLAEQNPSPLFLEWLEPFLKKDKDFLQKKASLENVYDPLLKWALVGRSTPNFKELIEEWGDIPQRILKKMKDAWF